MGTMTRNITVRFIALCFIACSGLAVAQLGNPSPELMGQLTKQLSITPDQAVGGSGALFGLAKTRLKPEDFTKISNVVPGMDQLLKAAPQPKGSDPLGAVGSALPGKAGGLASTAGVFKQLGMSPNMATRFVPILSEFVKNKGGSDIAKLLSGALK
jgi:hypothetical protein